MMEEGGDATIPYLQKDTEERTFVVTSIYATSHCTTNGWPKGTPKYRVVPGKMTYTIKAEQVDEEGSDDESVVTTTHTVSEAYIIAKWGELTVKRLKEACCEMWGNKYDVMSDASQLQDGTAHYNLKKSKLPSVTFSETTRQISGMMYDKERGVFYGRYKDPFGGPNQTVDLDKEWVESNFSDAFIAEVKRQAMFDRSFVNVPPGRSSRRPVLSSLSTQYAPLCMYQQDSLEICATSSLACAFHFAGFESEAEHLDAFGKEFLKSQKQTSKILVKAICMIQERFRRITKLWHCEKIDLGTFRPLAPSPDIAVMVLLSADGSTKHAVSTVNGWIFDSNESHALPLMPESFDRCCDATFTRVYSGYRFTRRFHNSKKRKHKK
jgi:hypothetical protein